MQKALSKLWRGSFPKTSTVTVVAVLADQYGCDGSIASALVIATYGLSLMTIPLIMLLTL